MTARSSSPSALQSTSPHPFTDLSRYTAQSLVDEADRFLADPGAVLSAPISYLTSLDDRDNFSSFIHERHKADAPDRGDFIARDVIGGYAAGGPTGAMLGAAGSIFLKGLRYNKAVKGIFRLVDRFTLKRPIIQLAPKDIEGFRHAVALAANGLYTPQEWHGFFARYIHADGASILDPDDDIRTDPNMARTLEIIRAYVKSWGPSYDMLVAKTVADAARYQSQLALGVKPASLNRYNGQGSKWMDLADIRTSSFYDLAPNKASLLIGYEQQTDAPIYFSGNESLITVGGPGSGKSQAQVITNLLRFPGSAVILDVKGELWNLTAGWREKSFGPVYRFAPTDRSGNSHRYNPFDFISRTPDDAANECSVFSYQVMVDNPKLHDPYWENKGRDLLWAFAMVIALKAPAQSRTMQGLAQLMSIALDKNPKAEIHQVLESMRRQAARINIPDLASAANAITGGIGGKALESVFDTARRHLSIFIRSTTVAQAMSASDWHPQQLRARPGTSVYICLSPQELKTFAPIVRLLIMQHSRTLMAHSARPGEPPITFFLDEMPQLGNFESVLELQDVGRGAGLRLWMFAQALGQLSTAFGADRFESVVDACRCRCFLQPDNQAARLIEPNLGKVRNFFNGIEQPLASASDLMGRAFKDKIVVTTRGDDPLALNKKYAWQTDNAKFLAAPVIKKAGRAP